MEREKTPKWIGEKGLWLSTIIPLVITIIALPFIQDQLPAHYDINGEIDRWGSKYEQLIIPIIIIILSIFWKLFINYFTKKESTGKTDKDRKEASSNKKVLYVVAIGMALMFTFMHMGYLYSAIATTIDNSNLTALDPNVIANVPLGLFIIGLGNYLPKTKRNAIAGVRTSATMDDDQVWSKSNKFGGIVFIIAGILIVIQALIVGGMLSTFISLGLLIIAGIVITIKSYTYK